MKGKPGGPPGTRPSQCCALLQPFLGFQTEASKEALRPGQQILLPPVHLSFPLCPELGNMMTLLHYTGHRNNVITTIKERLRNKTGNANEIGP